MRSPRAPHFLFLAAALATLTAPLGGCDEPGGEDDVTARRAPFGSDRTLFSLSSANQPEGTGYTHVQNVNYLNDLAFVYGSCETPQARFTRGGDEFVLDNVLTESFVGGGCSDSIEAIFEIDGDEYEDFLGRSFIQPDQQELDYKNAGAEIEYARFLIRAGNHSCTSSGSIKEKRSIIYTNVKFLLPNGTTRYTTNMVSRFACGSGQTCNELWGEAKFLMTDC